MSVLHALASLGLLCAASHTYAQSANRIALDLPGCLDASWREQLVSSARVELLEDGAILTTLDEDHPGDETHVAIAMACNGDASEARIQLAHAAKSALLSRTVQLSDVPHSLRPRTLALALAELWRTSQPSAAPKDTQDSAHTAKAAAERRTGNAGTQAPRNAAQQAEAAAVDNKTSVPKSPPLQERDLVAAVPQAGNARTSAQPTAATPSDTSTGDAVPSDNAQSGAV
ncbi:MAG TPA: hypothetical protein VMF89_14295, partial [Polyangiales bacterium]|nr:hypothetical protein [Polyangiales bacterium]